MASKVSEQAPLLLASASPRRRELLEQIGVSYRLVAHCYDESALPDEAPRELVQRLALGKARSVLEQLPVRVPAGVVLGADTIVVCQGHVLGKPGNRDEALNMLTRLAGRTHEVYSAVSLCSAGRCETRLSVTRVTFRPIPDAEQWAYWESGEPQGKAGAYAIQGIGAMFVSDIKGSYSGVVGLPLFETAQLLTRFGVATALSPHGPGELL